jgi:hypothetical protein
VVDTLNCSAHFGNFFPNVLVTVLYFRSLLPKGTRIKMFTRSIFLIATAVLVGSTRGFCLMQQLSSVRLSTSLFDGDGTGGMSTS